MTESPVPTDSPSNSEDIRNIKSAHTASYSHSSDGQHLEIPLSNEYSDHHEQESVFPNSKLNNIEITNPASQIAPLSHIPQDGNQEFIEKDKIAMSITTKNDENTQKITLESETAGFRDKQSHRMVFRETCPSQNLHKESNFLPIENSAPFTVTVPFAELTGASQCPLLPSTDTLTGSLTKEDSQELDKEVVNSPKNIPVKLFPDCNNSDNLKDVSLCELAGSNDDNRSTTSGSEDIYAVDVALRNSESKLESNDKVIFKVRHWVLVLSSLVKVVL